MELWWDGASQAIRLLLALDPAIAEIVGLSLFVSTVATLAAAAVGIPIGAALAVRAFPGRYLVQVAVNTGMGLPPVVVGLVVTIFLWRTGTFGSLGLLYTPGAMIIAQFIVAAPIAAGLTRAAVTSLDPDLTGALRADGATEAAVARELALACWPQVVVAAAAAFGRAIAEVGASLMVGGNLLGQTRILTTAIALEAGKGDFALALALGLVLIVLAMCVNAGLAWWAAAAQP